MLNKILVLVFKKREKLQQNNTKVENGVICADHMENF